MSMTHHPPPSSRPERAEVAGSRRRSPVAGQRLAGVAGLVMVLGLTALSWALSRPPQPEPATTSAAAFSAERAFEHLRVIAPDHPTPIGSAASDEIQDHLAAELGALGFQVEVQAGVGGITNGTHTAVGRVANVVATLPGADPTGRVLLSAHYDTTFASPGAADDKAAVAATLETARALTSGEPLRNDVVILLTDGEEPGMLGASAFTRANPASPTDVVLNWEATGNSGPSMLFEASRANAGLIQTFARWAPRPVGDSAMVELYRDSGQNTDLTVLQGAGFRGLNFALTEGTAFYHHGRDTVDNLDPGSVQHHGDTMLALARGFGSENLAHLGEQDGDRVFFTAFGRIWTYPEQAALPLAGLAALLVLLLAVAALIRGATTVPRLIAGAGASLGTVGVAGVVAAGWWEVLVAVRPGYGAMFMGEPFRPVPYRWALIALVVAVTLAGYLLLRRRIGADALHLGVLSWLALLGVVAAVTAPGASFYGTVPAGSAALAALLAPLLPAGWWRSAGYAVGTVPGVVLLVQGGLAVLGVMGLAQGYAAAVMVAVTACLVLPLLDLGAPDRPLLSVRWALLPAGAVLGFTVVGLGMDRFDPQHPQPAHLSYVQDGAGGTWVSTDADPHPWTAGHAAKPADGTGHLPLPYGTRPRWTGPAPTAGLPAPQVSGLGLRQDGAATVVELHAASARDADVLVVHVNQAVEQASVRADGHPPVNRVPTIAGADAAERGYELRFYDPPAGGVRLTLRLAPGGGEPVIHVSDYTVGLESVPGFVARPPGLSRSADHSCDLVVVGAAHTP